MKTRLVLSSILTAQVVLALGLMWQGHVSTSGNEAEPWLDFPAGDVSKVIVADSSHATTHELKDDEWRLADSALPANSTKITTLLTTLDKLETTWPVVSTEAGRERFEVTEDKHQKQLSLFKGDTLLGKYYFGTSPGFRRTHARRADDNDVYALAFNNFDLPADSNDWLDKNLLSAKEPTAIEGPDFALTKTGTGWQFATDGATVVAAPTPATGDATTASPEAAGDDADASAEAGASIGAPVLNAEAAKKFVDALTNLRVLRVADSAPEGEPVVIDVKTGETSLTYRFTKVDSTCYVQRSDIDHTFTLAEPDYKAIAEQSLAGLSMSAPAATTDAQPAATESAAPSA
jgi:hypothetical protein